MIDFLDIIASFLIENDCLLSYTVQFNVFRRLVDLSSIHLSATITTEKAISKEIFIESSTGRGRKVYRT